MSIEREIYQLRHQLGLQKQPGFGKELNHLAGTVNDIMEAAPDAQTHSYQLTPELRAALLDHQSYQSLSLIHI